VLKPFIPSHWKSFSFNVMFRGATLNVNVTDESIIVTNETDAPAAIRIYDSSYTVGAHGEIRAQRASVTV